MVKEKPKKIYKEISQVNEAGFFFIEKVVDWPKRIENYSLATKNRYAMAFAKQKEFFEILDEKSPEWKVTHNKKGSLYCEQKTSKRGWPIIRAKGPSKYDCLTSLRLAGNAEYRKKYDKNIQTFKMIS